MTQAPGAPATVSIRAAIAQSGLVPIDAQVLLAFVLGGDRAWVVAHAEDALGGEHAKAFSALAQRRRNGEPIAYLTGFREFWGLPLRVSASVLIPRHETETLVEIALAHIATDRDARVLDLGTGSGAVALAIAHERPHARVVATDVSQEALAVARDNAQRLSISNVEFVRSDWYRDLPQSHACFDVVVSNPPYVAEGDAHLEQGDLRHEPALALTSGADGLLALRRVISDGRSRLAPAGCVAVEHGYDQAEAVQALFHEAEYVDVRTARDLSGIPRVTYGRLR